MNKLKRGTDLFLGAGAFIWALIWDRATYFKEERRIKRRLDRLDREQCVKEGGEVLRKSMTAKKEVAHTVRCYNGVAFVGSLTRQGLFKRYVACGFLDGPRIRDEDLTNDWSEEVFDVKSGKEVLKDIIKEGGLVETDQGAFLRLEGIKFEFADDAELKESSGGYVKPIHPCPPPSPVIRDLGDGLPVKVHPCRLCGVATASVDDCGEFGNPKCPRFGKEGVNQPLPGITGTRKKTPHLKPVDIQHGDLSLRLIVRETDHGFVAELVGDGKMLFDVMLERYGVNPMPQAIVRAADTKDREEEDKVHVHFSEFGAAILEVITEADDAVAETP